jgi:ABC-2 type transport system permease protein
MRVKKYQAYGRAALAAFELAIKQNLTDSFVVFGIVVQPLIIAVLGLWMLGDKGAEFGIFVVIGSGMTGLWSSLLFISGNSITWERWTGTLEFLVGQPTPVPVIVFGKNFAHVLQSLLSMIASYLLASIFFDYGLDIQQPILFAISLLLTVIAFVTFGLIIAPVFVLSPSVQRWQNAMEFPIFILCGFLFPIALLPGWTTPISYLLTPYWAARALHGTSSGGASINEVLFSWGMLLVFSVLYLFLSRILFRVMIRKARIDATLGMQ